MSVLGIGGWALLVGAVLGVALSEQLWLRVVCGAYLGLYFVLVIVGLAAGALSIRDLGAPVLLALLALFVASVKKSYSKW